MIFEVSPATTCLFLDVDGSLLDIASRPEGVVVPPTLRADLNAAADALGGAMALISGRSVAQLDHIFAPCRFRASGVHGAEWRGDPDGGIETAIAGPIPRAVWTEVTERLRDFPGTFAEDKRYSFAVHYRALPSAAATLEQVLAAIIDRSAPSDLRLMPGHFVYEIKGADFDKGRAVRRFMREGPFAGRTPIFIGDDVTDLPGFSAAIEAGGRAYGVGREIQGTTGTFDSPSAVRHWLSELAAKEHENA